MCGSVAPGPADPLVYIEQIRLLCCEYEIRTNSRDLITRLSGFTPHAEQDMPVVQRRTVIITWTGDEFQISSDGIDDFELSQTGALETLFQHLHRSAIAAMPDYIRLQAVCTIGGTSPTIPVAIVGFGDEAAHKPGSAQNDASIVSQTVVN